MALVKMPELDNPNTPYRNKSLKSLKGERWEDIPGMEEYYLISNYGRVKSLPRDILYSNGKLIHKKCRILMAGITADFNHFTQDHTYQLGICLHIENQELHFSIARLVYHCFVEPFNLEDQAVIIVQKDGNGLNCYYKNLIAVDPTTKQKKIFLQKRGVSCFAWLDMKAIVQKDMERRFQMVSQYDTAGKRIRVYKSIKVASETTGATQSGISAVLAGCWQKAGGFVWKRGKGPARINLKGYFDHWKIGYKEKRGKKVVQLTKEGKPIKQYASITDAAKATGISYSGISGVINGRLHTAGGYVWKESRKQK